MGFLPYDALKRTKLETDGDLILLIVQIWVLETEPRAGHALRSYVTAELCPSLRIFNMHFHGDCSWGSTPTMRYCIKGYRAFGEAGQEDPKLESNMGNFSTY